MLINVFSAKCEGIEAAKVTVEVDIAPGIGIHLVGLADAAVKESLLRTTTALVSLGFHIPGKKIVINLAPADVHKKGSGYDVPIAIGIIAASGQRELVDADKYIIMGELSLDGSIRPVPGALPIVEMAEENGFKGCILPVESAAETIDFATCDVYGVNNLNDVLAILEGSIESEALLIKNNPEIQFLQEERTSSYDFGTSVMDFSEIVGQEGAKRGLEIAAAGGHNVIMVGPPGSGKSSLAKALGGILPKMTTQEAVQTSKIYSVAGRGSGLGLMRERPFRAPHYSASLAALLGGGSDNIMPGEVSLAHNGVLFADEFCEAPKRAIEALRAPMEDRKVVISRLKNKVEYPASFMLVAATNPCPCGYFGEGDRCTCPVGKRLSYLAKLSGPIMDRIDIQLWMHSVDPKKLVRETRAENSATVAERVMKAREIQKRRFEGEPFSTNAEMSNRHIKKWCVLDSECTDFLEKLMNNLGLSARACSRILKLARTIADLEASPSITLAHLSEAASYRFLDKVSRI
ncbi:MAG: YifB family Mg chelatase-like AAA ATPase [Bacteroidales bacterium]|nr:YifB family Mg chelatase-like AAA ATPase [Bacteroidales bacterium]